MNHAMNRRSFLRFSAAGAAAAMLPLSVGCSTTPPLPAVDIADGPLAFAADGTRFEADPDRHQLVITTGGRERRIGGLGREVGKLNYPIAVAIADELVYVVDHGNHRVQIFDAAGASVGMLGEGALFHPAGLVATDTEIAVADTRNARIVVFAPDGEILRIIGSDVLSAPRGLARLGDHLLVADPGLRQVLELAADGSIVRRHTDWVLPYAVATDGDRLYVADVSAQRITVLERGGARLDTLDLDIAPRSVMLAADGLLYVS